MCWHPDPEFGVYGLSHFIRNVHGKEREDVFMAVIDAAIEEQNTNRPVRKPDLLVDSGESKPAASIRAAPEGGNRNPHWHILRTHDGRFLAGYVEGNTYKKLTQSRIVAFIWRLRYGKPRTL